MLQDRRQVGPGVGVHHQAVERLPEIEPGAFVDTGLDADSAGRPARQHPEDVVQDRVRDPEVGVVDRHLHVRADRVEARKLRVRAQPGERDPCRIEGRVLIRFEDASRLAFVCQRMFGRIGLATDAERFIRAELETLLASGNRRVLFCADFGYAYPAGFASLLPKPDSGELPPWRIAWEHLSRHVRDDLGTKPGRKPTNRSNRFEVASAINVAVSEPGSPGPFWCLFKAGGYACIPQKMPRQPFVCSGEMVASLRITDRIAESDSPFRLFGTGSVGSQVLTGILYVEPDKDDFCSLLGIVDEPLAFLPLEKTRPGREALDEIMESLR